MAYEGLPESHPVLYDACVMTSTGQTVNALGGQEFALAVTLIEKPSRASSCLAHAPNSPAQVDAPEQLRHVYQDRSLLGLTQKGPAESELLQASAQAHLQETRP